MPRALTGITNSAPQVSGFSKVARREVEYHGELFKAHVGTKFLKEIKGLALASEKLYIPYRRID